MASYTSISLADGIKSPWCPYQPAVKAHSKPSPAHAAFMDLSEALAEANVCEEFRASEASWDPAYAALDADAEAAIEAVIRTAKNAGSAPIVLASDRKLVYAARLIACAMSLEDDGDRDHILHFMTESQSLWSRVGDGPIARQTENLIELAFRRLLRLNDLMYHHDRDTAAARGIDWGSSLSV